MSDQAPGRRVRPYSGETVLWARLRVNPGRCAVVRPRTMPSEFKRSGRNGVMLSGRGPVSSVENRGAGAADVERAALGRIRLAGPIQLYRSDPTIGRQRMSSAQFTLLPPRTRDRRSRSRSAWTIMKYWTAPMRTMPVTSESFAKSIVLPKHLYAVSVRHGRCVQYTNIPETPRLYVRSRIRNRSLRGRDSRPQRTRLLRFQRPPRDTTCSRRRFLLCQ